MRIRATNGAPRASPWSHSTAPAGQHFPTIPGTGRPKMAHCPPGVYREVSCCRDEFTSTSFLAIFRFPSSLSSFRANPFSYRTLYTIIQVNICHFMEGLTDAMRVAQGRRHVRHYFLLFLSTLDRPSGLRSLSWPL